MRVDVADPPRRRARRHRDQFVAGGENGGARPPVHLDLGQPESGEQADLLGAQAGAGGEHRLAGGGVFAPLHDVFPRRHALPNLDGAGADLLRVFDHHHAVRAARQEAAGGNPGALAGVQGEIGEFVDLQGAHAIEIGGAALASAEAVGGAQGVAVHGRAAARRQVFRGDQLLGQHPPPRPVEGDGLGGGGDEGAQHLLKLRTAHRLQKSLGCHAPSCRVQRGSRRWMAISSPAANSSRSAGRMPMPLARTMVRKMPVF